MIQANELRIGNTVAVNSQKAYSGEKYIRVQSISSESINMDFRDYNLEDLEPVTLTHEILEKCGAKKVQYKKNTVVYLLGELLFRLVDNACLLCIETIDDYNSSLYTITEPLIYLHELQNLVFAITKNELEIKL